jgi:hypothetical protein
MSFAIGNKMKIHELVFHENNLNFGDELPDILPNCNDDTLFTENGKPIGFYIADLKKHDDKMVKYADIADYELRSKNVPKTAMARSTGLDNKQKGIEKQVDQYSTILGFVPKNTRMRRPYNSISSVHREKKAAIFIKSMLALCESGEELIRKITPEIFYNQEKIISENIPKEFRFGRLFTSSISNANISAPIHIDTRNLRDTVNIIIVKKRWADGGHTTVPDYGLTVNSANDSMLVYPAWRNKHAVTPIKTFRKDGYRNSLVFYPLKFT